MRRGTRITVNVVLVVALGAAGWGTYQALRPSTGESSETGVRTVAAGTATVTETVSAAATIASAYAADADFATGGKVATVDVKVGDVVAAGARLAGLDSTTASKQVTAAKADLVAADEDLSNAADDAPNTAQLQAKVDQAELSLAQAKETLAATVLTAPGAGTVTAVNGRVGQQVSAGGGGGGDTTSSAFVVITDLTNLVATAKVAEIDVSTLAAGQAATVTVNALPDTPVAATVTTVDLTPTSTNSVVQFGVSLGLTGPPPGLRPGQSASVSITVAKAENVIAVPSAAVRTIGTQSTVTVLAGGQQETRQIEVGVRGEALVEVKSGLAVGDQVVLPTAATNGGGTGGNGRNGGNQLQVPGGAVVFGGGPGGAGAVPGGGK